MHETEHLKFLYFIVLIITLKKFSTNTEDMFQKKVQARAEKQIMWIKIRKQEIIVQSILYPRCTLEPLGKLFQIQMPVPPRYFTLIGLW